MSQMNQGYLSGILMERPTIKNLDNGMAMARILIEHTAPGFRDQPGKRTEIEVTAWGDAAQAAAQLPQGAHVLCSFKLGSRSSEKNGATYRNVTVSVSSIVALAATAKAVTPPAPAQPQADHTESVPF